MPDDRLYYGPYVDPDDPTREVYRDDSGHVRRRAVREGTLTREQIREDERMSIRQREIAEYTHYLTQRLSEYAHFVRQTEQLYARSPQEVYRRCTRQGRQLIEATTQYELAHMNASSTAVIRTNIAEAVARTQALLDEYQVKYDALFADNPYARRDEYGDWLVISCGNCGVQGSATFALQEVRYRDTTVHLCATCSQPAECSSCHTQGTVFEIRNRSLMTRYDRSTGLSTHTERRLCDDCYITANTRCDNCGVPRSALRANDSLQEQSDGSTYCGRCRGSIHEARIHSHGWCPPVTHWLRQPNERHSDKLMYFGMEIETENVEQLISNGAGAKILTDTGLFYAKSDGSISDGFEAVSHPFTWPWLTANAHVLQALQELGKAGFRGFQTTTCGMHVHMSKAAMPSAQVYKLLRLIYAHPEFIALVAQRAAGSLNRWANPNIEYRPRQLTDAAKQKFLDGKYRALNLSKRNTAEVRIFRSTLSPNGVQQNLEFCKAALDYTGACSVKEASNTREFVGFVLGAREAYRHLHAFLAKKGQQQKLLAMRLIDSVMEEKVGNAKYYSQPVEEGAK